MQQALVYLVDAECEARNAVLYDLDEPESAFPARDMWGRTSRGLQWGNLPALEYEHRSSAGMAARLLRHRLDD